MMQVQAVADKARIAAAMASPDYRSISHIMRETGLEPILANGGEIPPHQIDEALKRYDIGTTSRIALKATLGRLRLIKENAPPIQAAMASPAMRAVRSLMASADIESPISVLSLAEVDAKLSKSGLTTAQRIQVKSTLSRAGLMV